MEEKLVCRCRRKEQRVWSKEENSGLQGILKDKRKGKSTEQQPKAPKPAGALEHGSTSDCNRESCKGANVCGEEDLASQLLK